MVLDGSSGSAPLGWEVGDTLERERVFEAGGSIVGGGEEARVEGEDSSCGGASQSASSRSCDVAQLTICSIPPVAVG